jgi:hypothetical protein
MHEIDEEFMQHVVAFTRDGERKFTTLKVVFGVCARGANLRGKGPKGDQSCHWRARTVRKSERVLFALTH